MMAEQVELIRKTILMSVGADIDIEVNTAGRRTALDVWFKPWEKSHGPVFQIKPAGLKSHRLRMKFGKNSGFCLGRIKLGAAEQTAVARGLLLSLESKCQLEGLDDLSSITSKTEWSARVRDLRSQHDEDEIRRTTREVMVPMVAAMAELIGFDEVEKTEPQFEGHVSKLLVSKRERSSRNRLLALQIHGHKCGTCDLKPVEVFGEALGGILEVHHIEPLSEAGEPRAYDPTIDLIPLCPNCHRMIHRKVPAMLPGELRNHLQPNG